jgi:hypothetical protein
MAHTERLQSDQEDEDEMPYKTPTPVEPDEQMPALEAYDDVPERLVEDAPQPVIEIVEDREARQRALAELEQRVAQIPRAPLVEEEEEEEEDAQDAEPMGDDDMDGALEGACAFTEPVRTGLIFMFQRLECAGL